MAVEAEHGQIDEVSRGFDAACHPGDVSDLGELDLLFLGQILRVFPECLAGVRHVLRFFVSSLLRPGVLGALTFQSPRVARHLVYFEDSVMSWIAVISGPKGRAKKECA